MKRIALALAVIASLIIPVASVTATAGTPHKVFVCKYVGTPGVNERLQTGNNPIDVDYSSIKDAPADIFDSVGFHFADAQTHSIVIAVDTGQDEPSIDDCPPPAQDEPTPTPTPTATPTEEVTTQPPTEPPTEEVTTQPPTEPPSEEVTTEPPTPTPTPSFDTPTPSVGIDTFSLDVCPDLAAIIRGDQADTVIATIPPGQSAIRFRAIGAILLIALHVRIDGQPVVPDGDGVVLVTPGTHAWSISNAADTEVLAAGDVDCPVCGRAVTPPPNDVTNPPKRTLPPTDALGADSPSGTSGSLPLVMLVLAGIAGGSLLATRKRR